MSNPFTIRIFVPEGDPEGLRIIDRQSSPSKFFTFPRSKWSHFKNRPELTGAGIYILTGYSNPEDELPTVYIGQADTIYKRIDQHNRSKDFWDKGFIFASSTINSTHAKWLEYALIKRVVDANRSIVENGNNPQEPRSNHIEGEMPGSRLDFIPRNAGHLNKKITAPIQLSWSKRWFFWPMPLLGLRQLPVLILRRVLNRLNPPLR